MIARFLAVRTRTRNTSGHARRRSAQKPPSGHGGGTAAAEAKGKAMDDISDEFMQMDDSALLALRAEMRAELERLPPASPAHAALTALYDKTTAEVDDRARRAWTRAS
jgi:hypothetical protein